MSELYPHPTDEQIFQSPYKHSSRPRAAYLKAYAAQERQTKSDQQRAANTTPDVTRSPARFNPPDDERIVKEHQRLRAAHRGFAETPVQQVQIPVLDATGERLAAEAFWWYSTPLIHPDDSAHREMALLRWARILKLLPDNAVFQGGDDPIRSLALRLIQSPGAAARFAGKY